MRALDRKLARDLWQARSQVGAIALVMAAGVALAVLMRSGHDSLEEARRAFYERYRLADVFVSVRRAPLRVVEEVAAIPGVARAEARIVVDVTLDLEGVPEPATGRLVGIPEERRDILNGVFVRAGRYIDPRRPDEVLVSEAFARANGLGPGDSVTAVLNGHRRELRIVGIGLSPEYVMSIGPGQAFPDDRTFGVLWIGHQALAAALDMEGAWNDLSLDLAPGASEADVIARLDRLLEPYGGLGAIPRSRQPSNWYLQSELDGLRAFGAVPLVTFLTVAAFLINVVMTRTVAVQRQQIAALKALGYSNAAVAWHYTKWALAVAALGAAVGTVAGAWLGARMTALYAEYYRFPVLAFRLNGGAVVLTAAAGLLAAVLGALGAVRRAMRLPPAEAMRPEPPGIYRESRIERPGLRRLFSLPTRIVLRNLERRPGRAALSTLGIALGTAILVAGQFSIDAATVMIETPFSEVQRYDVLVSFSRPEPERAYHEVRRLPGVLSAEGFRSLPVRLVAGHRSRYATITGLPSPSRLHRVLDQPTHRAVELPPDGLVLSATLASRLGVRPGDRVRVEVLEGHRPVREVLVAGLVDEYLGTSAYMEIGAAGRLAGGGRTLTGAYLRADPGALAELYARLKAMPGVAGVVIKRRALENFRGTLTRTIGIQRAAIVALAVIIAFGVVYNTARVTLSERALELGTLRVIGFRRGEISYILLGELAVVTLAAIPLGLLVGYGMAAAMVRAYDTDLYRLPLVVTPSTLVFAAVTILVATAVSALVIQRRLDRQDLVAVLKTRE